MSWPPSRLGRWLTVADQYSEAQLREAFATFAAGARFKTTGIVEAPRPLSASRW